MSKKTLKVLKVLAIVLASILCAALIAVGVLWLLNEYKVIDVQWFLDYLYDHFLAIVTWVSSIGIAGIISIIGGLIYNTYKITQAQQVIDTKVSLLRVVEKMEAIRLSNEEIIASNKVIHDELHLLLNYETIMANKNLSSAILTDKDKDNLKSWIVSTTLKSSELVALAKKAASPIADIAIKDTKPTIEETKAAITKIVESADVDDTIKTIVKGMM